MATNDVKFKLSADATALVRGVENATEALRGLDAKATSGITRLSGAFDTLKGTVIAGGLVAAFGALSVAIRKSIDAAAEAESVQARLAASLKATGNYSEDAISGINSWSAAMLQTMGVSDELAASLVAEGVAMGKTIEQSKRLAEAAANMAPIVGSVEGAFSLLIRASNGSMESLKRYGVAVSEAEMKSGDFESVLKRIEERFSGQAEAGLKTYNGQLKLLKENIGNLSEEIGQSPLEWMTDVFKRANEGAVAYLETLRLIKAASSGDYSQVGQYALSVSAGSEAQNVEEAKKRLLDARTEFEKWQKGGPGTGMLRAAKEELNAAADAYVAARAKLDAKMGELQSRAAKRGAVKPGDPNAPFAPIPSEAALAEKKRKEAEELKKDLERMANAQDAFLKNLGNSARERIDAQKSGLDDIKTKEALIRGEYIAQQRAIERLIVLDEQRRATLDRSDRLRMDWQKGGIDSAETLAITLNPALKEQADIQGIINNFAISIERLNDLNIETMQGDMAASRARLAAQKDYTDADKAATEVVLKGIKIEKDKAKADMEAVQAAYSFAQALVSLGQNLRAGNTGGTISSLGTLGMLGGAFLGSASAAGPWAFGIGAAATVAGGLIQPGTPRTYGGQSRNELQNRFGDVGLKNKTATTEQLIATGMADVYMAWGRLILGVTENFQGAGEIVYGKLKDLNLTFAETAEAVSYVNAEANKLTMSASDMATAWAGMLVAMNLSANQIGDLVDLYQRGSQWQEQWNTSTGALRDAMERGDKAAADMAQEQVAALLQQDMARKEEARQMLEEAGISAEQQAQIAGGVVQSNFYLKQIAENTKESPGGHAGLVGTLHHGRMVGGYPSHRYWVRDDEDVVPPEKRMSYAANVMRQSGGGGRTINVTINGAVGNHRDIAKRLHAELQTLREFGEVGN